MSQGGESFFTSIGCMDGRCQEGITSKEKRKKII